MKKTKVTLSTHHLCLARAFTSMTRFTCFLVIATLIFNSVVVGNVVTSSSSQQRGIVTIPLVPHSVVQQRRRLLLQASGTILPFQQQQHERPSQSRYEINTNNNVRRVSSNSNNASNIIDPDASEASQIAGLFQGYGTHYADLWCGTPPQRQTVIVDTGSGVTAFPCNKCTDCGVPTYHIDALFHEDKSTTFHKLSCTECLRGNCGSSSKECSIGMSYEEGSSWTAYEAADTCYVGGFHDRPVQPIQEHANSDDLDPFHAPAFAFDMKFGCQTQVTGLFKTQLADGIMGMDVASASFWWQMFDAGKITSKAFSLCFSRQTDAARTGTEAGAMSLGGTDARLHNTPMVYSATQESSGFYVVQIRKVYLRAGGGGISAKSATDNLKIVKLDISEDTLNSGRVIVDSGTTDTYFSRKLGTAFNAVYHQLTGETYGNSVKKFTPAQLAQQPTILFQFYGDEALNQAVIDRSDSGVVVGLAGATLDAEHPLDVILAIPPEHYYEYDPEVDGYVSRFYVSKRSGGGVLGANAMMGHDVYFDVAQYRVGWAESSCDYTKLVSAYTINWSPSTNVPIGGDPSRIAPVEHDDETDGPFVGTDDATTVSNDDDDENGDKPSDNNYDYEPPGPNVCSGLGCQVAGLICVVVAIVYVTTRMVRRAPTGPVYDLAQSELELRAVGIDDDDDFVNNNNNRRKGEYS